MCHVNLLKPYYDCDCGREGCLGGTKLESGLHVAEVKSVLAASSVENTEAVCLALSDCGEGDLDPGDCILQGRLRNSEALGKLDDMFKHLPTVQCSDLVTIVKDYYTSLFPDTPTQTNLIEHDINVGDAELIRQRYYRVSLDKRKYLDAEIEYMLQNNISVPSISRLVIAVLTGK